MWYWAGGRVIFTYIIFLSIENMQFKNLKGQKLKNWQEFSKCFFSAGLSVPCLPFPWPSTVISLRKAIVLKLGYYNWRFNRIILLPMWLNWVRNIHSFILLQYIIVLHLAEIIITMISTEYHCKGSVSIYIALVYFADYRKLII